MAGISRFGVEAVLVIMLLVACRIDGPGTRRAETQSAVSAGETQPTTDLITAPDGASDVLQAAISTSIDAILNGVNLHRVQAGLLPLVIEPSITEFAYERSVDMAVQGYLDHRDRVGGDVPAQAALEQMGYSGPVAELIYAARDPIQDVPHVVLEDWFADLEHAAVLFDPGFRYAGLGISGDGTHWIVTMLVVGKRP